MLNAIESGFQVRVAQLLKQSQSSYGQWNQFSIQYMKYTDEQKANGYKKLVTAIHHPDDEFLYRGTTGNSELQYALKTGHLGHDVYRSGKRACMNLPSYIRDNDSAFLFSASECPYTAKPYASGLQLPCRGFIIVMGLPKVITMPRTLLRINKKAFTAYDDMMLSGQNNLSSDGGTVRTPIQGITEDNNETTIVTTDNRVTKNWKPQLSTDIYKIVEVCGPGKWVGNLMTFSKPIFLDQIFNPDFRKQQWTIEVIMNCEDDMDHNIETAIQEKIIAPENRFLTIEDAAAIDDTGMLDTYIENDVEMQKTIRLRQVPRSIPIGHQKKLQEYMEEHLQETQKITNMRNLSK